MKILLKAVFCEGFSNFIEPIEKQLRAHGIEITWQPIRDSKDPLQEYMERLHEVPYTKIALKEAIIELIEEGVLRGVHHKEK